MSYYDNEEDAYVQCDIYEKMPLEESYGYENNDICIEC